LFDLTRADDNLAGRKARRNCDFLDGDPGRDGELEGQGDSANGEIGGKGDRCAFGDLEVAEVATLPPDPNPTGGAWIIDRSMNFQASRPMLDVDEFEHRFRTGGRPALSTRLTEPPPSAHETILVDRVGIRKYMALDQYIGGVERIDEGPHRLVLGTAL